MQEGHTFPEDRFWRFAPKGPGCWEWQGGILSTGYGQFRVAVGKSLSAHRASWRIHHGEIPAGLCVLHKCDNRKCVNPDHLFLGTRQENMADMVAKGRGLGRGGGRKGFRPKEHGHLAKLNPELATEIKELYAAGGHTHQTLAAKYGVARANITRILNNKSFQPPTESKLHN